MTCFGTFKDDLGRQNSCVLVSKFWLGETKDGNWGSGVESGGEKIGFGDRGGRIL